MLINGQDTITDIGHACGLGKSSYLGKIFRKYQNCTPIEYRKNGRIVISYVRNKIAMRKLGKMFLLMFRFIAIMEKHFYVSVKNVIKEVKKEAGLDVNTDLVIAV